MLQTKRALVITLIAAVVVTAAATMIAKPVYAPTAHCGSCAAPFAPGQQVEGSPQSHAPGIVSGGPGANNIAPGTVFRES